MPTQHSTRSAPARRLTVLYEPTKRLIDLVLATILIIVLLPLFIVVAVAVVLDSGRPILFRPTVKGRGGTEFRLLKFRSMIPNASEVLRTDPALHAEYARTLKIAADPRITRLGKFLRKASLDELPQLLNVVRGEMSLVGPRVLSDTEYQRYGDVGPQVLSVRPGISGLWQVSGRHTVSFERRLELDLEYLRRRSLWLDLVILLRTVPAVFGTRGAG